MTAPVNPLDPKYPKLPSESKVVSSSYGVYNNKNTLVVTCEDGSVWRSSNGSEWYCLVAGVKGSRFRRKL